MSPTNGSASRGNRGPAAAADNRRALLDAARELFAAEGLAVPLNAIARRAGVGQGSLYRHFPTRTALAVAVFEENLDAIDRYLQEGGHSLDDVFALLVEQAVSSTALIELVSSHREDPAVAVLGDRFAQVVAQLLATERAAGRVADDVTVDDIRLAVGMLAGELARVAPDHRAETARRARRVLLDGLAPRD